MSNKLFPIIVGSARIREAGSNGEFYQIECATNVKTSISTSENVAELSCGLGESLTVEKPTGNVTLKVIKTKNPDLLGKLLDFNVTSVVAGANTITDESNTLLDDKIEMLQRSNDDAGITAVVVKSSDGVTTYTVSDDYTVSVLDNKTTITRVGTGIIAEGETLLISGSVNQNAYKKVSVTGNQRAKKVFSIELFGQDETTGKYTTMYVDKVTLDSEYLLEMVDMFRDGVPTGAELTFKAADGFKMDFVDENV